MNDNIPYVPNSTPTSPIVGSCYYNVLQDKYYVYNGTQGIAAICESEASDRGTVRYKQYGSSDYSREYCNNGESLLETVNRNFSTPVEELEIKLNPPEAIYTVSTGNTKADGSLLKIFIDNMYVTVGRIPPKIVCINNGNKGVLDNIFLQDTQLEEVYCNNVIVHSENTYTGYILTYTNTNDEITTRQYTNYSNLVNDLKGTQSLDLKKISIIQREEH